MLVLSRNLNEEICIGDDIVVTVMQIGRGRVRLGVSAPRDVPVHRREVADKIEADKGKRKEVRADG